jgi:hypothetical protein
VQLFQEGGRKKGSAPPDDTHRMYHDLTIMMFRIKAINDVAVFINMKYDFLFYYKILVGVNKISITSAGLFTVITYPPEFSHIDETM